jgi:hypothetical protein
VVEWLGFTDDAKPFNHDQRQKINYKKHNTGNAMQETNTPDQVVAEVDRCGKENRSFTAKQSVLYILM